MTARITAQNRRPDEFFSAAQQGRLEMLMARWRQARDTGVPMPADEQAELEALVEAEVNGAAERASALAERGKQ